MTDDEEDEVMIRNRMKMIMMIMVKEMESWKTDLSL